MSVPNFDAYIFDVDGTLYSQKKVRFAMFLRLFAHYLLHPFRWRELWSLYLFRKLRECSDYADDNIAQLCREVEKSGGASADEVEKKVWMWMFEKPLDLLARYRFKRVIDFINHAHDMGKVIVIYSDYPVKEKLARLNVKYDMAFVSCDNSVAGQKPSVRAMEKILSDVRIPSERILYVGDRDDKDRASAEMVDIAYMDIKVFRNSLSKFGNPCSDFTSAH